MTLPRPAIAIFLVLGVAACEGSSPPSPSPTSQPTPATPAVAKKAPPSTVRAAVRCEECHESYVRGWRGSAHARSGQSGFYRALRARGDERCDRCHQPLRGPVAADDPIHAEGITCDACHSATALAGDAPGAGFDFDVVSKRRYGPLCQSEDHYFHRMGCSPLHAESRFCAGCHHLEWQTRGGATLPVITDFVDWQAAAAGGAAACQDCHMHGAPGEVARGWIARDNVSRHDLFGEGDELRRAGVGLSGTIVDDADGRWLEVVVQSQVDAHPVPAGLAGRRLILRVVARDRGGAVVAEEARTYARILGDDAAVEVPFDVATRVVEDTRLRPGERRRERVRLPAEAAAIEATIVDRALDPAVAAALGLPPPTERAWASLRLAAPSRVR